MKKSILLCLLAFSFSVSAQTIRRVNNDPTITGANIYTTPQSAHDAAVAGDIIVMEPVSNVGTYSSLTITKQINIVGNGYFLDKNPNTPADKRVPYIGNVVFNKGSANSTMTGVKIGSSVNVNCNNITISRCDIGGGIGMGSDGSSPTTYGSHLFVSKSIIGGGINGNISSSAGDFCIFLNNLIINSSNQAIITQLDNCTFSYNTYIPTGYGSAYGQIGNTTNCVFSNNIFDWRNFPVGSGQPFIYSSATSNFSNNIAIGVNGLPTGNGNVNNASSTNLYANASPLANYTALGESVFQLGVGSAAIGIGTGGTDAGAFGGANPYMLSGLPPNPIITNFTTSSVGNTSTPLNVSVTVRGNN